MQNVYNIARNKGILQHLKRVSAKYGTKFLIYRIIGNIRREACVREAYMF